MREQASEKTTLLFGVHAHQPAGNFPSVLDEAHERCYRPFLETLHRYADFRFAAHFSGPLLDYLLERYPGDMRLLGEMVARGQVEMFGGGETEPVLAAIPQRDRLDQLAAFSQKLAALYGAPPEGAWLTERVWEATVVPALARSGIRYATVDDYHFLCAGKTQQELRGYFTTEEDGAALDLFPISEALRYRIPFSPAAEAVAYLETLGGAAVYFDDIEKFGIWPETHDWVYGKEWLRRFVEGVLASPKIAARTFREFHASVRSRGIVYLPTASYFEMNEWTLPAAAGPTYAGLVAREKQAGRYEAEKPFLRGGIWKNFMSRYPEANWMHKRMLGLSERLAALPEAKRTPGMRRLLHLGQANDAYWHGLFGGLYLPHLRHAVYRSLVGLEALLDAQSPRPPHEVRDLDRDGCDELFLQNGALQAVLKLDGSASIVELDAYALAQNFGDTLRRHAEHYHHKVRAANALGNAASGSGDAAGGVASAHDRVSFKHEIAEEDLATDAAGRTLFRDRLLGPDGQAREVDGYAMLDMDDTATAPRAGFRALPGDGVIDKRIALQGSRLVVSYRIEGLRGVLLTELNIAMPSCNGYAGRYILRGEMPCGFGQPLDALEVGELVLDDRFMGGALKLSCSPPASLRARPLHTVSQSEGGFEKIMQCVVLTLEWPLAQGSNEISVTLEVS